MSDDHFSVDGTLVKTWATMKTFQPKTGDVPSDDDPSSPPGPDTPAEDQPGPTEPETAAMPRPTRHDRNAEIGFRGEKGSYATNASTTDPDARLYRKFPGTGAMLCFMGHALMENCSGVIVQGDRTQADGRTTRHEGDALSSKHHRRIEEAFGSAKTVGGMKLTVYRGIERVRARFILTMTANKLARPPRLLAA